MYIDNKYTKYYFIIIEKAKNRELLGYSEKHHIIPKSLGGSDKKDNLVKLTAKEHFTVHHLLTKMLSGQDKYKMYHAYFRMSVSNNLHITNRQYQTARTLYSISSSAFTKRMWNNPDSIVNSENFRKRRSEIMTKIRNDPQSVYNSLEFRKTCSISQSTLRNTEEFKKKQSIISKKIWEKSEHRMKYEKTYIVTDPEGNSYTITGLNRFCIEQNLIKQLMYNVMKGKQKQHKGWKIKKIE